MKVKDSSGLQILIPLQVYPCARVQQGAVRKSVGAANHSFSLSRLQNLESAGKVCYH